MSEVGPVNGSTFPQRVGPGHSASEHSVATIATVPQDEVEISSMARALSLLNNVPDIRMDKVEAIRASLANNTYDTSDKFNVMIDRLMEDVYA